MRAVKSSHGKSTERSLRARLVAAGVRGWQMHVRDLPGTPDFVFSKARLAIFVDGCFWHGCVVCYRRPHSSQDYWDVKVKMNRRRDARVNRELRRTGWSVRRIWEHELHSSRRVSERIAALLAKRLQ
jgi:DNA mismatch endonuclease (patch repair protein)